jgi:hypothetical protein
MILFIFIYVWAETNDSIHASFYYSNRQDMLCISYDYDLI